MLIPSRKTITSSNSSHVLQAILEPILEGGNKEGSQCRTNNGFSVSLHENALFLSFSSEVKIRLRASSHLEPLEEEELAGGGIAKVLKDVLQKNLSSMNLKKVELLDQESLEEAEGEENWNHEDAIIYRLQSSGCNLISAAAGESQTEETPNFLLAGLKIHLLWSLKPIKGGISKKSESRGTKESQESQDVVPCQSQSQPHSSPSESNLGSQESSSQSQEAKKVALAADNASTLANETSLRSILCSPDLPLPLAQLLTSITIKILKYHLVHPYGPLFNGKWISRRLQVDPYLTSIAKSLSTMASRSLAHTSNPDLQNALERLNLRFGEPPVESPPASPVDSQIQDASMEEPNDNDDQENLEEDQATQTLPSNAANSETLLQALSELDRKEVGFMKVQPKFSIPILNPSQSQLKRSNTQDSILLADSDNEAEQDDDENSINLIPNLDSQGRKSSKLSTCTFEDLMQIDSEEDGNEEEGFLSIREDSLLEGDLLDVMDEYEELEEDQFDHEEQVNEEDVEDDDEFEDEEIFLENDEPKAEEMDEEMVEIDD